MSFISHFQYGYNDGKVYQAIDENSQTTNFCYFVGGCTGSTPDPWGRLTQISYPDGGSTTASYVDTGSNPTTTISKVMNSTTSEVQETIFDGMGRAVQTQALDPLGTVYTNTLYDGLGQVYRQSNPTRCSSTPGTLPVSCSEPTWGYSTLTYDSIGRKTQQQNPDGSIQQWCYNDIVSTGQTNCHAHTISSIAAWTDTADENCNDWQRTSDGLGRLTAVAEPSGSNPTPTMLTNYAYDALGDLLSVSQIGNGSSDVARTQRSFTYDSLSRLLTAVNGESGSLSYSYDANGNVQSKTVPQPSAVIGSGLTTTTNYFYDVLNRLTAKSYSDGSTPWSCYLYDSATNGIGRLASEWTQKASIASCPTSLPSSPNYFTAKSISAYDQTGRLWSETQCTPSGCRSSNPCQTTGGQQSFAYDLAGNLTCYNNGISSTPAAASSPVAFFQSFDAAGRLSTITTNMNNPTTTLFAAQGYAAFGGLTNATYGSNGSGTNAVSVSRTFDTRLRVTSEADLGNSPSSGTNGSALVTITGVEQSR